MVVLWVMALMGCGSGGCECRDYNGIRSGGKNVRHLGDQNSTLYKKPLQIRNPAHSTCRMSSTYILCC